MERGREGGWGRALVKPAVQWSRRAESRYKYRLVLNKKTREKEKKHTDSILPPQLKKVFNNGKFINKSSNFSLQKGDFAEFCPSSTINHSNSSFSRYKCFRYFPTRLKRWRLPHIVFTFTISRNPSKHNKKQTARVNPNRKQIYRYSYH